MWLNIKKVKIIDKDIENIAYKILNDELEYLRKRFYPYKRRPFLRNKIILKLHKRQTIKNSAGYYTNCKTKKKYRYKHIIHITKDTIEMCEMFIDWNNKEVKDILRPIIRHELIHAFVYEEWDTWDFEKIKNINADYSPIFLTCLYWANGNTNHIYTDKFYNTELFQKVNKCSNYNEIQNLLICYLLHFEKVLRKLSKNTETVWNDVSIYFNSRNSGLLNRKCIEINGITFKNGKLLKVNCYKLELGVGFLITPEYLMEHYNSKFNNRDKSILYSKTKTYFDGDKIIAQVINN